MFIYDRCIYIRYECQKMGSLLSWLTFALAGVSLDDLKHLMGLPPSHPLGEHLCTRLGSRHLQAVSLHHTLQARCPFRWFPGG